MDAVIEASVKSEVVRDPEITQAIRALKEKIKQYAVEQKRDRKFFRQAVSAFDKAVHTNTLMPGTQHPHSWFDGSVYITAALVIYHRLRQTKKCHFGSAEKENDYFTHRHLGPYRRGSLSTEIKDLPEKARSFLQQLEDEKNQAARLAEKKHQEERDAQMRIKMEEERKREEEARRLWNEAEKKRRYEAYLKLKKEFEP